MESHLFQWPVSDREAWVEAAEQVARLIAAVEAGELESSPAEMVGLQVFVATVQGVIGSSQPRPPY